MGEEVVGRSRDGMRVRREVCLEDRLLSIAVNSRVKSGDVLIDEQAWVSWKAL